MPITGWHVKGLAKRSQTVTAKHLREVMHCLYATIDGLSSIVIYAQQNEDYGQIEPLWNLYSEHPYLDRSSYN
jgi:hypothetical protein